MEYFSEPSKIIKQELQQYPQAQLQDIYKLFYQGSFGPAHFIKSRQQAGASIKMELVEVRGENKFPLFQNISYLGWFYRVDLNYLTHSNMKIADFSDLFYRSSLLKPIICHETWLQEWGKIEEILFNHFRIPNYRDDRKWLQKKLQAGELIFSHSAIFSQEYQPHYRLIYGGFIKSLQAKKSLSQMTEAFKLSKIQII